MRFFFLLNARLLLETTFKTTFTQLHLDGSGCCSSTDGISIHSDLRSNISRGDREGEGGRGPLSISWLLLPLPQLQPPPPAVVSSIYSGADDGLARARPCPSASVSYPERTYFYATAPTSAGSPLPRSWFLVNVE